jgi:hypothetical protein
MSRTELTAHRYVSVATETVAGGELKDARGVEVAAAGRVQRLVIDELDEVKRDRDQAARAD